MGRKCWHLHDAAHRAWSERTLGPLYEGIRRRCRGANACLEPFAPHETRVNGGVYYAFHATSDVREYAAELAIRYLREQRLQLLGVEFSESSARFKCLTEENAVAWRALSEEFFGGLDLVPKC